MTEAFVPGKRIGPKAAANGHTRFAFVAEAPSDEEIARGEPLVGPSGRIFDGLLRMSGIDRAACFITNVFHFKLPNNKIDALLWSRKNEDEWLKTAVSTASPPPAYAKGKHLRPEFWPELGRLRKELIDARPDAIVALGSTALWALTGSAAIGHARGYWHFEPLLAPIMPTYHPAYLLRKWKDTPLVTADLIKAKRGPGRDTYDITVWPTIEEVRRYVKDRCAKAKVVVVDIETIPSRRAITTVGLSADPKSALVIPFVDWRQESRSYWPSAEIEFEAWRLIESVMNGPVPVLMQNGAYDAYWLWQFLRIPSRSYTEDTRLLHHALQPEMRKDLRTLGSLYADVPPWKHLNRKEGEKRDG